MKNTGKYLSDLLKHIKRNKYKPKLFNSYYLWKVLWICGIGTSTSIEHMKKAWFQVIKRSTGILYCIVYNVLISIVYKSTFFFQIDSSGEIVTFPNGGCPWRDHLFDIEQEQGLSPTIKYVLYPDNNGNWRIQCVPVRIGSFENR